jgi:hypothetical protein
MIAVLRNKSPRWAARVGLMIAGQVAARAAHDITRRCAHGDSALSAVMKANNNAPMNVALLVFIPNWPGACVPMTLLFCPI